MRVGGQRTSANGLKNGTVTDPSFPAVYDLWIASWETALAAVATASQNGALSADAAAAHRTVIAAERAIVTKHLTLLVKDRSGSSYLSRSPNHRLVRARIRLSDDVLSQASP